MEVKNAQDAIEAILKNHAVETYFTPENLRQVAQDMIVCITEVLGDLNVKYVSFHDDDEMFFDLNENFVHLGLGIVKKMLDTWFEMLTAGGSVYMPPEIIKEAIIASLMGDAAHEAGHRVIDLHPIKELGFTPQQWGRLGVSGLDNALKDCRNDQRIMNLHPNRKQEMDSALEFSFGPGGRQDWPSTKADLLLRRGYPVLFREFDSEAIRLWAYGKIHENTDPRVRALLEKERATITYIAHDRRCVPGKNPSPLERKTKAIEVSHKVLGIFEGQYQDLLRRDMENQAIHQAISIVGLAQIELPMNGKLKELVTKALGDAPAMIRAELQSKLAEQKDKKREYDAEQKPLQAAIDEIKDQLGQVAGEEQEEESQTKPRDYFDLLGPAVLVEELSDETREFLLKLFQDMQQAMQDQILSELIKQLLENPEKFLKWLEDEFSKKIRPHTVPTTVPTHADLKNEPTEARPVAPLYEMGIGGALSGGIDYEELGKSTPRELEAVERWLEEHLDMRERIEAFRRAIHSTIKRGRKKTDMPSSSIDFPALVQDEIRQEIGIEPSGKIFLESDSKREKITLSVLWRTVGVSTEEALKLIVFLTKIYEDPEINRYLDLEILVSQEVPGVRRTNDATPIPVVIGFDQHPIRDFEKIMENLLALQKTSAQTGPLVIVQDVTALRTQRIRLLAKNPRSRRRFLIDLWDEEAIEKGFDDPMDAVKAEIRTTQEALKGKAFCFVLKQNASAKTTPANAYGKDHFLLCDSTESLIHYLDIVVRDMIKYQDNYASHIRDDVERELDIVIPDYT